MELTDKLRSYNQTSGYAKVMVEAADEIDRLRVVLMNIGNLAHDASTGPAVPDVFWEIRRMAYDEA
jgi:hypothetical protein